MKLLSVEKIIMAMLAIAGVAVVIYWLAYNPVGDFQKSIPGMDNRNDSTLESAAKVIIGEDFLFFEDIQTSLSGKWPGFRGSNYNNISTDKTPLIDKFSPTTPEILWETELGEGHAAAAIFDGRVYILDYIEDEKSDALRCMDLITGIELWQRKYHNNVKRNHGMSRTIPAVTEDYILTIGPKGHVMCVETKTGNLLWVIDLVEKYSTEIPFWYTGQCPLIDNNIAVLAPGGDKLLIGVDCKTGKVLWETPNPGKWKMSHSSIIQANIHGKNMYIYAAIGGICGVSAEDQDIGKMLWSTTEFSPNVVAPSPVVFNDGKVFMTAGYGAGSVLLQVNKSENGYYVDILQKYKPKYGAASEQQTAIPFDDHLFIILPKDAGAKRNQFVCCKYDDPQNILWTSGKENRFGLGPYVLADNKFYILDDNGTMTIAKASTAGFKFLDSKKIFEANDAWGPIAVADGKMVMRDSKKMLCVDMQKH